MKGIRALFFSLTLVWLAAPTTAHAQYMLNQAEFEACIAQQRSLYGDKMRWSFVKPIIERCFWFCVYKV